VSVVDLTVTLEKPADYKDIMAALKEASQGPMKGILGCVNIFEKLIPFKLLAPLLFDCSACVVTPCPVINVSAAATLGRGQEGMWFGWRWFCCSCIEEGAKPVWHGLFCCAGTLPALDITNSMA
jgi:hypothetical protein